MNDKETKNAYKIFLKSMLFTAAAIVLFIVGYFAAEYFFT